MVWLYRFINCRGHLHAAAVERAIFTSSGTWLHMAGDRATDQPQAASWIHIEQEARLPIGESASLRCSAWLVSEALVTERT